MRTYTDRRVNCAIGANRACSQELIVTKSAAYDFGVGDWRDIMTVKAFGLAGLVLFALSAEASARCSVPRIRTFDNQTSHGNMSADSSKPCRIRFGSSSGPMDRVEIVQRPTNGTVTTDGLMGVTYRSRAGYTGSDSFTYARRGLTHAGTPSTRTVQVSVTVR